MSDRCVSDDDREFLCIIDANKCKAILLYYSAPLVRSSLCVHIRGTVCLCAGTAGYESICATMRVMCVSAGDVREYGPPFLKEIPFPKALVKPWVPLVLNPRVNPGPALHPSLAQVSCPECPKEIGLVFPFAFWKLEPRTLGKAKPI